MYQFQSVKRRREWGSVLCVRMLFSKNVCPIQGTRLALRFCMSLASWFVFQISNFSTTFLISCQFCLCRNPEKFSIFCTFNLGLYFDLLMIEVKNFDSFEFRVIISVHYKGYMQVFILRYLQIIHFLSEYCRLDLH